MKIIRCAKCICHLFRSRKKSGKFPSHKVGYAPISHVRCPSVSNDCNIMRTNHCGAIQLLNSLTLMCFSGERKETDLGGLADFIVSIMFIGGQ